MVIKPAEDASLSTVRLAELLAEAGLPDGVLNVVTGIGPVAGQALSHHPDVDKVSFTGSAAVGQSIPGHIDGRFRKVVLEDRKSVV